MTHATLSDRAAATRQSVMLSGLKAASAVAVVSTVEPQTAKRR